MKALQKTCCIIALLVLSLQSARHFYVKYFDTSDSALDAFEKKDISKEIEDAKSLDELIVKYEPAKKKKDELEDILTEQMKGISETERHNFRMEFQREHEDEYNKVTKLSMAIRDWETKSKQILEVRVFWLIGFILFVIGGIVYLKLPWLGMALIIPGVVEMCWWTSPSFRFAGNVHEFERLLNNKLIFTNITLLMLIVVWSIFESKEKKSAVSR